MLAPEDVYHIYNCANGTENLFREERNYHFFLEKYFKYAHPIAETFAYCLMPNHFHIMVRIRSEEDLTGFENLSGLCILYTKVYIIGFIATEKPTERNTRSLSSDSVIYFMEVDSSVKTSSSSLVERIPKLCN